MEVRVPCEKRTQLKRKIAETIRKQSLSLKEIQSLIGSLNFICRAVKPGRAFLRRLTDQTKKISKPDSVIQLSEGTKSDLTTWLAFLDDFNGVTIVRPGRWESDFDLDLFTDASGTIGFGGYFHGKWFCGHWPPFVLSGDYSIAWKEMVPIAVALLVWGSDLAGKRIRLHTDNMAIKNVINKQTSHCPRIMSLVRTLVLQCLKRDTIVKAVYIATKENDIADSLSRLQMSWHHRRMQHQHQYQKAFGGYRAGGMPAYFRCYN
ncbi:uncharacterized protein LOC135156047 [Lytechinus pictus]|uniref:uncharacterized protein LOC135156047 n=1 Tax=Lytechinus pictus TaxID=7653 RepID=UPI0030B9F5D6